MSRFNKLVWIGFTALIFVPMGTFAIAVGIEDALPERTARLEVDLRAKVSPGSSVEQIQTWLVANGFPSVPDLPRRANEPPHRVTLWVDDPAWFSSAEMWIDLQFDEQGRFLAARITSRIVSL